MKLRVLRLENGSWQWRLRALKVSILAELSTYERAIIINGALIIFYKWAGLSRLSYAQHSMRAARQVCKTDSAVFGSQVLILGHGYGR
jgi:hypothetical protein